MRIIGKLHDYYDGLMAYGQDNSVMFTRVTQTFDKRSDEVFKDAVKLLEVDVFERSSWRGYFRLPSTELTTKKGDRHTVCAVLIGFCGKMYFGLHVKSSYVDNLDKYIYSVEDAEKLEQIYEYKTVNDWEESKKVKYLSNMMHKAVDTVNAIDTSEFLMKYKVPYFVINTSHGEVLNVHLIPELKMYDFQRVKDPYTAYQEISMYMGGVIPQQPPEGIVIRDVDRIFQHGFNKFSFRHPIKFKREK